MTTVYQPCAGVRWTWRDGEPVAELLWWDAAFCSPVQDTTYDLVVSEVNDELEQKRKEVETLRALLVELRSARPLLLYGEAWIARIEDVLK